MTLLLCNGTLPHIGGPAPTPHEPIAYAATECPLCARLVEMARLVREVERLQRMVAFEGVEA